MNGSEASSEAPAVRKRERFFDHHMWCFLVLSISGLLVYQAFKYQAFPNASIELKKTRLEIQKQAQEIAPTYGFKKNGLIESTVFHADDDAKSFLEHEYSQEEANRLMLSDIPVWSWHTRLCKEFDQEEFQSWISPQGKLVSFEHDIPNDQVMNTISHEQARDLALDFVKKMEPDANQFSKLVRDEVFTKPKRQDHSFTWENQSKDYKGSRMRLYVYVSGDQITEYNRFLHVPDSWQRQYETLRSYNQLLGQCAFFFIYAFQTVAFMVLVWGMITKNVRWKPMLLGSLIMGGISSLDYLNHLPALIADYSPTTSFNDFMVRIVIWSLTGFFGNAIMGAVLFAGAEICYRKLFPDKVSFEKIFSKRGLAHQSILKGVLVGHLLVGVHLGWIVLYYILGKKFNIWCPLGIENHQVLSNIVPFVSAVALGVSASFEEELACRVVGIAIGTKLLKNFWLANLFQALVWGFAHSSYPQEPAWARGVELTVVGLLQGWILHRFGIVAVITEHYLLDAFMDVESFLYSDVTMLKLSVIPALIPPALIVLTALVLNRKVDTSDELNNDRTPLLKTPPPLDEELPAKIIYTPLSKKVRLGLLFVCLVSLLSAFTLPWATGVNANARLHLERGQAISRAREVLKRHNLDPGDWSETVYSGATTSGESYQYLFEKTDAATVKRLYDTTRQGYWYGVRFFKPLKAEEYTVYLDGKGDEVSLSITRQEDDPGAKLTAEDARKRAQKYLEETHPELAGYEFVQISRKERKNRFDYTVQFRVPKLKVQEADYLVGVSVIGDQVGNFTQTWEVPDSWSFEREKRTAKDEWLSHLRSVCFFAAIVLVIVWGVSVLRTGAVRFRPAVAVTCIYLFISALARANQSVTFWNDYDTTTPPQSFVMSYAIGFVSSLFAEAAGILVLTALSLAALRILCPRTPLISYFAVAFARNKDEEADQREARVSMWFDATLAAYASLAFAIFIGQLQGLVSQVVSPSVCFDSIGQLASLTEVHLPIAEIGLDALKITPLLLSVLVLLVGLAAKFTRGFLGVFLAGCFYILVIYSAERYWQDYAIQVIEGILLFLVMYVFAVRLAKTNYLTYVIVIIVGCTIPYVKQIAVNGNVIFVPELITLSVVILSPLLIVSGLRLKNLRLK